ncbi:retrotransposon-related protein [Tanacetum coccineum]
MSRGGVMGKQSATSSLFPMVPVYHMAPLDVVEDVQKVKLAFMHMYDRALAWHQQFSRNNRKNVTWEVVQYKVYIDAFDLLMTKVEMPETQAIRFFLGGLDKEIEMSVYGNLEITRKSIEETIELVSRKSFEHLVHEGKWESGPFGTTLDINKQSLHSYSETSRGDGSIEFKTLGYCHESHGEGKPDISILDNEDTSPKLVYLSCLLLIEERLQISSKKVVQYKVYIDAFDLLMTKVVVPETQAISFFLGGLDKEIEMSELGDEIDVQYNEEVFGYVDSEVEIQKREQNDCNNDTNSALQPQIFLNAISGKDAIEEMFKELLDSGVIRASHSPFSSPIMMVKKKDGSWRMCVDYRALMNDVFAPSIRKFVLVFFDDILVYSKDMVAIGKHLTILLKKNSFEWSDSTQMAFDELKVAMINAPVLALSNFQEEFIVETDASDEAKTYNTFSIKWLPELLAYAYEILYKKGSENIVVVALLRSLIPSLQTMLIAKISNDFLQRNTDSWVADPSIQQVVYGQKPLTYVSYMAGDSHVEVVARLVLLKLQPHRQVTLRMHKQHKFSLKFYGPFQVVSKCGVVAYKLILHENAIVHNVFNISQLKPFKGQPDKPIPLPHFTATSLITTVLVAMLERKTDKAKNATVGEILTRISFIF